MLNSCGYTVCTAGTTTHGSAGLYPGAMSTPCGAGYKSSTYPRLFAQFIQQLIHRFSRPLAAVTEQLFPTIHTTNKNNKKFFLNNLLLIDRKAV